MVGIKEVLDKFCGISGKNISYKKSSILFSKNIDHLTRKSITQVVGLKETKQLGLYLGITITGKSPKERDFHHVVEKVKAKLTMWKAKHLSMAERLTLAKVVLEDIPT